MKNMHRSSADYDVVMSVQLAEFMHIIRFNIRFNIVIAIKYRAHDKYLSLSYYLI